jgi:hypothetical protein
MTLEKHLRLRNRASYDLPPHPDFSSDATALRTHREVAAALALLDAIEADPARHTAAIASLPP